MTEEQAVSKKRRRPARRWIVRLVRLGAIAALGVWVAKQVKSRSNPPEGLWREGISGNGSNANRH
ncbi:MAG TPA: hypothetical protein VFW71_12790 [Actinomycetota bacterium]|jgi:hypothetical protein|nr:hypothetical protein [Actinomycetota bacterium]